MGKIRELKGAEVVLECLKEEGVDTIFGYPGGSVIPLYDALYDYRDDFKHILTSHEQGASHGADGYGRSTDKVGVCIATSGPGATNTITGIATAFADSIPLIVITGQVGSDLLGRDSFQEVDITNMTLSITKHNFLVRDIKDLAKTMKDAFRIAKSGRRGPVLIDIPKDILISKTTYEPVELVGKEEAKLWNDKEILDLAKLINDAKYPIIYGGGGIIPANASEELVDLAERGNIPVVNSLMGLGGISREHPLSLGLVGMHGFKECNLAIAGSDLIIAIGARFSDRVTGRADQFGAKAKVIQIDIDEAEVGKNKDVDYFMVGNIKEILSSLNKHIEKVNRDEWIEQIQGWKLSAARKEEEWSGVGVIKAANRILEDNTIVVTDVGQHQMWTAQHWRFKGPKTLMTSGGLGTMGYGLGAAIGTQVGNPDKQVVLVTGDGSFRMNCNELGTVSKYRLPIIVLLLNNSALGMVRQWQGMFFDGRYSETDLGNEVDFVKLAGAYGICGERVTNVRELESALKYAKNQRKAMVIECVLSKEDLVLPIVPAGQSIENMLFN